eukprot:TRINITY_DN9360_c0_g3_i1.p1 TRINITY_DN9360_c0_g3~~TRINITY_DN9360_c0_g3_i1.p1  ORF type:complete len:152 (-),score=13.01 TRINITY_DN9360_c0_g3_i1:84-539(-)
MQHPRPNLNTHRVSNVLGYCSDYTKLQNCCSYTQLHKVNYKTAVGIRFLRSSVAAVKICKHARVLSASITCPFYHFSEQATTPPPQQQQQQQHLHHHQQEQQPPHNNDKQQHRNNNGTCLSQNSCTCNIHQRDRARPKCCCLANIAAHPSF